MAKNQSNNFTGKIPPQAKELEAAILGACLIEKTAFSETQTLISAECFYTDAFKSIYRAMAALSLTNRPIDCLTVCDELRASNELTAIGGEHEIFRLTNHVVSSAHLQAHCRIVKEKYILREIIRLSSDLINGAYESGAEGLEMLEMAEKSITELSGQLSGGGMLPIDKVLVDAFRQVNAWRERPDKGQVTGIPTGNRRLDMVTRGWQNGDLIILAARPSTGKTAMALSLIKHAGIHCAENGGSVALFSLEMPADRIILRLMAAASKIWLMKIQTGNLTEEDMRTLYTDGVKLLAKLPIKFGETRNQTLASIKSQCREMKRKGDLKLVIIDYLQLIRTERIQGQSREQQVSYISSELKSLALELQIPVIALSQLSREVEKRSNPEPVMSDLRESGGIENDADLIIFLYRYLETEIMNNAELENKVRLKIGKQRDGMLDRFDVNFYGEIQMFEEIKETENKINGYRPISAETF